MRICSDDVYLSRNSFAFPVPWGAFYRVLYIQAVSALARQVEQRDLPFFRRERQEENVDRFIMYLVVCIFRCCGLWLDNEENLSLPCHLSLSLSLSLVTPRFPFVFSFFLSFFALRHCLCFLWRLLDNFLHRKIFSVTVRCYLVIC